MSTKGKSLIGDILAEMRQDVDYLPEQLAATFGRDPALVRDLFRMAVKAEVMVRTARGYRLAIDPKKRRRQKRQIDWVGRKR